MKSSNKFFLILAGLNLLSSLNTPLMNNFYSPYATKFGINDDVLGMLYSLYSIVSILTSIAVNRLQNEKNRHILLSLGMFLQGMSLLVIASLPLSKTESTFLTISIFQRILNGIGFSIQINTYCTFFQIVFASQLEKYMSYGMFMSSIGELLSPILGSTFFNLGSFSTPFIILGSLTLVCMTIQLFLFKNIYKQVKKELELEQIEISNNNVILSQQQYYCKAVTSITVITCILITFSCSALFSYFAPFQATFMIDTYDLSDKNIGYYNFFITLSYSIGVILVSKVKSNRVLIINLSLLISALCSPYYGPDSFLQIKPSLMISMFAQMLQGFSIALVYILILIQLNKELLKIIHNSEICAELASMLFTITFSIGEIIGPIVSGQLMQYFLFPRVATFFGCFLFFIAILSTLIFKILKNKQNKLDVQSQSKQQLLIGKQNNQNPDQSESSINNIGTS